MVDKIDQIFKDTKAFSSDRISIEPVVAADFDIFYDLYTNEEVTYFLSLIHQDSKETLLNSFNKNLEIMKKGQYLFVWTIFLKEPKIKIGRINIGNIDMRSKRCSLGFVLLPAYWGKGIMYDASKLVIQYMFNDIEINKICASCNSENTKSSKLLEKLGFKLEGVFEKHTYYEKLDEFKDDLHYGLINPNIRHDK